MIQGPVSEHDNALMFAASFNSGSQSVLMAISSVSRPNVFKSIDVDNFISGLSAHSVIKIGNPVLISV